MNSPNRMSVKFCVGSFEIKPCLTLAKPVVGDESEQIAEQSVAVYFVQSTSELELLAQQWSTRHCLALDTEFERRTTFFAKLALVQIYDGEAIYLLDPLAIDCPESLRTVLESPKVVKILHSSKEDIEVLFTSWNCKLAGLFDTQVAYHLLESEPSIGYAKLVEVFHGIQVSKQQTQSDWIKRPLSEAQLRYAAKDVIYLISIYESLKYQLVRTERESLFNRECAEIVDQAIERISSPANYREAKDVSSLNARELVLFERLFNWRDAVAKADNRTKNHIIKDHQLVQLIKLQPKNRQQLSKIPELRGRSVRNYGETWLEFCREWQQQNTQELPVVINPRDITELKPLAAKIEDLVKSCAKQQGIPASLIMSKRIMRKLAYALITQSSFPPQWCGWRKELLAQSIAEKTKQFVNS